MRPHKGFTLIEIIIVMVIVAVVSVFFVNNYTNAVTQTMIQANENNLRAISVAQQKYNEDRSVYYSSPAGPANDFYGINSKLSLSMEYQNNGFNYLCATSGSTYTCTASNSNYPSAPGTTACVDINGNVAVTPGVTAPNGQSCTACGGTLPCGVFGSCTAIPVGNCDCSGHVTDLCGSCGGACTAANGETCSGGVCACTGSTSCGAPGSCAGIQSGKCDCAGDVTDLCGTCAGACTAANHEDCHGTGNTCECTAGYTGTPGSCTVSAPVCTGTIPANVFSNCNNTPPTVSTPYNTISWASFLSGTCSLSTTTECTLICNEGYGPDSTATTCICAPVTPCPSSNGCSTDSCGDICGSNGGACTGAQTCTSSTSGVPGTCQTAPPCTADGSYISGSSSCCNNDEDKCGLCGGSGSECSGCTICCGCEATTACSQATCDYYLTYCGGSCGGSCTVLSPSAPQCAPTCISDSDCAGLASVCATYDPPEVPYCIADWGCSCEPS